MSGCWANWRSSTDPVASWVNAYSSSRYFYRVVVAHINVFILQNRTVGDRKPENALH